MLSVIYFLHVSAPLSALQIIAHRSVERNNIAVLPHKTMALGSTQPLTEMSTRSNTVVVCIYLYTHTVVKHNNYI